jgi:hypothetical protein
MPHEAKLHAQGFNWKHQFSVMWTCSHCKIKLWNILAKPSAAIPRGQMN